MGCQHQCSGLCWNGDKYPLPLNPCRSACMRPSPRCHERHSLHACSPPHARAPPTLGYQVRPTAETSPVNDAVAVVRLNGSAAAVDAAGLCFRFQRSFMHVALCAAAVRAAMPCPLTPAMCWPFPSPLPCLSASPAHLTSICLPLSPPLNFLSESPLPFPPLAPMITPSPIPQQPLWRRVRSTPSSASGWCEGLQWRQHSSLKAPLAAAPDKPQQPLWWRVSSTPSSTSGGVRRVSGGTTAASSLKAPPPLTAASASAASPLLQQRRMRAGQGVALQPARGRACRLPTAAQVSVYNRCSPLSPHLFPFSSMPPRLSLQHQQPSSCKQAKGWHSCQRESVRVLTAAQGELLPLSALFLQFFLLPFSFVRFLSSLVLAASFVSSPFKCEPLVVPQL
ncbi:unnamed protein product [Closterium sp. Naga37s-1]|nr:unnamed protein product [Closterium sp. Naga37s-1]